MFGFTPIMPFVEQLTPYNTAGSAGALASNRNAYMTHEDRQASLAEDKRQFNETLPLKQFQTYMPQFNTNREFEERDNERDTRLLQWVKQIVEEDPEKAQAMAPHIKGILDINGIQMHLPGEAPPQAPAQPVQEQPAAPTQSEGEKSIADIAKMEAAPATPPPEPPAPANEEEGLRQLEQAQAASAATDKREESAPTPEPTETTDLLPGESFSAYMARLGKQAKPAPEPVPAAEAAPADKQTPVAAASAESAPAGDVPQAVWRFSRNGKELGSIDVYRQADINARRTQAMGRGFETGAMPKADQEFINGSINEAMLSGAVRSPEQLAAYIKNVVQPELDRRSRERGSFAMARAKGASGPSLSGVSTVNDDIMGIQREFAQRYGVDKLRQRQDAADNAIVMLDSTDPISQRDAFTQHLKAMFSSVTSDRELGFAKEAAGKLEQLRIAFGSYFDGGKLPENYKNLLSEANQIISDQVQKRLSFVGDQAAQYVMRTPALSLDAGGRKQAAGVVRGYFSGNFEETPELSGPMGIPGIGGGKSSEKNSESLKGSPAAPEMSKPPIPTGADDTTKRLLQLLHQ